MENARVKQDGNRVWTRGGGYVMHFPHLFSPATPLNPGEKPKFQVRITVKKTDTEALEALRNAFNEAITAGKRSALFNEADAKYLTFEAWLLERDGDAPRAGGKPPMSEKNPEFAGAYAINARSDRKPKVYDRALKEVSEFDADEIYGGAECNFDITLYPFAKMNKGVAVGLQAIQKTADGERFGATAENVFEAEEAAPLV